VRLLVVGGTQFVGRHVVQAALAAGHDVTLLHRGRTGADLFPEAEHRLADRDGDLAVLAQGRWDATVDVSGYVPRQVRALAAALGAGSPDGESRGGHYTFVSSVSAYADPAGPGITEDAPLATLPDPSVEEVTGETYGGLKALCEQAATETFGPGSLVVRPTYVVGPHDSTGRWTWWVRRLARGGEVLVAGPPDQPVQTVDGRDLGAFTVGLVEQRAAGPVHVAAPPPPATLADLLEATASAVAPAGTTLTWIDPAFAVEHGLTGRDLPLWHGGEHSWSGAVDPARAHALGFAPRPLADSARDVADDEAGTPLVDGVGLAPGREAEILRAWHARSPS
jgi:2'-hydroxyisoflavone reductase